MTNLSFYIENLDTPWVLETIAEKFDNATDLLTTNSVVYGGAVRDALAGLELLGDLDIAVTADEAGRLNNAFKNSVKWVMTHIDGKRQPQTLPRLNASAKDAPGGGWRPSSMPRLSSRPMSARNAGYGRHVPISSLTTFTTIGGAKVQIMVSKSPHKGKFDNALYVPRNVDIRCCGVAMDIDGNVYEVVKGAYQDCKDKVLRVNKLTSALDVPRMIDRIAKLEKRGWKNEINVKEVEKKVNTLVAKEKRAEKARRKKEEEKFMRKMAEEAKKHKGSIKAPGNMSAMDRFKALRLKPDSHSMKISLRELNHVKLDDFVAILQDVCSEENITAQVHPIDDGIMVETLDADSLDRIISDTWNIVDEEFGQPEDDEVEVAGDMPEEVAYANPSPDVEQYVTLGESSPDEATIDVAEFGGQTFNLGVAPSNEAHSYEDGSTLTINSDGGTYYNTTIAVPEAKLTVSPEQRVAFQVEIPNPASAREPNMLAESLTVQYEEVNDLEGNVTLYQRGERVTEVKIDKITGSPNEILRVLHQVAREIAEAYLPVVEKNKKKLATAEASKKRIEELVNSLSAEEKRASAKNAESVKKKIKAVKKENKLEHMRKMYEAPPKDKKAMPIKFQKMMKKGV